MAEQCNAVNERELQKKFNQSLFGEFFSEIEATKSRLKRKRSSDFRNLPAKKTKTSKDCLWNSFQEMDFQFFLVPRKL